jgi:hypothetical protein
MRRIGSLLSRVLGGERHVAREPGEQSYRSYDEGDHRKQLKRFARVSAELSDMHSRNGDPAAAASYQARSDEAQTLLADGFQHEQLKELALRLPGAPDWMNPKAIDSGLEVEPWQRDAAELRDRLVKAALQLRATGRY